MKFTPFPELNTRRLILRKLSLQDLEDVYKMRSDERMNDYTEEKNAASIRLLTNNNFSEINRMTEKGYLTDRNYNMIIFAHYNNQ